MWSRSSFYKIGLDNEPVLVLVAQQMTQKPDWTRPQNTTANVGRRRDSKVFDTPADVGWKSGHSGPDLRPEMTSLVVTGIIRITFGHPDGLVWQFRSTQQDHYDA
jgi:hypothetical protein